MIADDEIPNLVIMDINLAGKMDGIKAAGIIRCKHNIPIIFLTGYSDAEMIEKIDTIENAIYIKKPIDPEIIHYEIKKIFEKEL